MCEMTHAELFVGLTWTEKSVCARCMSVWFTTMSRNPYSQCPSKWAEQKTKYSPYSLFSLASWMRQKPNATHQIAYTRIGVRIHILCYYETYIHSLVWTLCRFIWNDTRSSNEANALYLSDSLIAIVRYSFKDSV